MSRKLKYASVRKYLERNWATGKASDFIKHFKRIAYRGMKVVIVCRVSNRIQRLRRNLDKQVARLRAAATKAGAIIVKVIRYVGSGTDPYWLARPAQLAKREGAILLAWSTSRLIRHGAYHSVWFQNAQATIHDLEELKEMTDGVTLATLIDPDASPAQERASEIKRGQQGNRGGRRVNNPIVLEPNEYVPSRLLGLPF